MTDPKAREASVALAALAKLLTEDRRQRLIALAIDLCDDEQRELRERLKRLTPGAGELIQ